MKLFGKDIQPPALGFKNFNFPRLPLGAPGYPESYSKGSQRLIDEARHSPMAQGYRRGQNTTQRGAIHAMHSPSNNMKLRGFTNSLQSFDRAIGVFNSWQTPSGQRSTSQQRVSAPSLNSPTPVAPIATRMPWNQ